MTKGKETSDTPKKAFDFFVGCAQIISTIVGVIALIISFITLIWAIKNPSAVPMIIKVISGESTPTPIVITLPTNTPLPTYTPQPTYTPFPTLLPTETPIPTPTATLFVPPVDGVLFQDNFDSGDLSQWKQLSGQWIVTGGKLTKLVDGGTGNTYQWISLDKPEWKNYTLSLDVNVSYYSNTAIVVRNDSSNQQLIGIDIYDSNDINLSLISNNPRDNTFIAGDIGFQIPISSNVNFQLEVQGNSYTLRVNGREIKNVTISGYESGGISIGSICTSDGDGCTTFDNIKVTYLP